MYSENALVLPITSLAKVGPSGTSIAPPSSPAARPTFTARTTGFDQMNVQPSRIWANIARRPLASGSSTISPVSSTTWRTVCFGSPGVLMKRSTMKTVTRNVRASK